MRRVQRNILWFIFIFIALFANGCTTQKPDTNWTNGTFYEIYVGSFYDSNGDKRGDLNGIIQKLDYLNDGKPRTDGDLQVNGLWLMPISPSPSYHKYDVTDYYNVDEQYGTLEDFRKLTDEAHKRGVKVIIDLVVNHTSDKHPWFIDASTNPNSPYRDYYVWADENTNVNERGPWGQKVWHRTGNSYFYGTFWSGMPDLNYDNPKVREEMIKIGKFWLDQGADGFRLDAALHIFPQEQEEKNLDWWAEFRSEMEKVNPNVYLVGEVWDSAAVIAPFFESLNSTFNFDVAEKIVSTVQGESDAGIGTYLERVYPLYAKYNKDFIDAQFLTNHDQNRVMSVLNGDVNKAKMAASILLTLPGNPFLYYGEEIGMKGQKPDEFIREPFRWYPAAGEGQTAWEVSRYNRGDDAPSVVAQMDDPESLLSHYRKMIRVRQDSEILVKGSIASLPQSNRSVVSFLRVLGEETVAVLHNVSGEEQRVDIPTKLANVDDVLYANGEVSLKKEGPSMQLIIPAYTTVILN